MLAFCEQVAPGIDLKRGRELRAETSTSFHHRLISRRGSLHRLFKLDVRLSLRKDLAHLGDIVLQEVFVYGMSDLQPVMNMSAKTSLP